MSDIFISYRRDGGEIAAHFIYERLCKQGYRVFLDVESLRSGKFNEKIYSEIHSCTDFLVILSPGSLDRCVNETDWVRLEIEHAKKYEKNIVPVLLRNFQFPAELPESLADLPDYNNLEFRMEWVDYFMDKLQAKRLLSKVIHNDPAARICCDEPDAIFRGKSLDEMAQIAGEDASDNLKVYQTVLLAGSGDKQAQASLGRMYYSECEPEDHLLKSLREKRVAGMGTAICRVFVVCLLAALAVYGFVCGAREQTLFQIPRCFIISGIAVVIGLLAVGAMSPHFLGKEKRSRIVSAMIVFLIAFAAGWGITYLVYLFAGWVWGTVFAFVKLLAMIAILFGGLILIIRTL